jgi:hypothetical protein
MNVEGNDVVFKLFPAPQFQIFSNFKIQHKFFQNGKKVQAHFGLP